MIDLDIPNLHNVKLPYSFKCASIKRVHSIYYIVHNTLDIPYSLSKCCSLKISTATSDEMKSTDHSATSIIVSSGTKNDIELISFDYSGLIHVESIEIGNDCFRFVQTFKIDGLNRLKTIKIGNNSFTQKKNDFGNDESKSFHILNCESLESIEIGRYSFSDFGGNFELKNLPQLKLIQIGKIGFRSYNFYNSSFVIRGTKIILNV